MSNVSRPLKWHGGKTYLAPWIISHFPPHTHYVETHFGGGAVLFDKTMELVEGHSEVINDLNGELMNFWQVIADPVTFAEFQRIVSIVPFGSPSFQLANEEHERDFVQRAIAFFVRYRQSRQGLGKDFATLSKNRTRRGMNEQVSSWLSAVEGLPEAHERLKRVVTFNYDACKVIRQEDTPNTLFYCDPPYLHETRVTTGDYEHEMTDERHEELLIVLAAIDGKFILSGYHSEMYDSHAKFFNWNVAEKEIDNKASGKKSKDKKTECLWMNF